MIPNGPELLLILVIALVLFGPSQLPKLGRMVGKTMREVRGAMDAVDPNKVLPESDNHTAEDA